MAVQVELCMAILSTYIGVIQLPDPPLKRCGFKGIAKNFHWIRLRPEVSGTPLFPRAKEKHIVLNWTANIFDSFMTNANRNSFVHWTIRLAVDSRFWEILSSKKFMIATEKVCGQMVPVAFFLLDHVEKYISSNGILSFGGPAQHIRCARIRGQQHNQNKLRGFWCGRSVIWRPRLPTWNGQNLGRNAHSTGIVRQTTKYIPLLGYSVVADGPSITLEHSLNHVRHFLQNGLQKSNCSFPSWIWILERSLRWSTFAPICTTTKQILPLQLNTLRCIEQTLLRNALQKTLQKIQQQH